MRTLLHVCTVDLRNTSECVILKALVNPSMRNPENAHSAWVATKKSGDIVAAHWEESCGITRIISVVMVVLAHAPDHY